MLPVMNRNWFPTVFDEFLTVAIGHHVSTLQLLQLMSKRMLKNI